MKIIYLAVFEDSIKAFNTRELVEDYVVSFPDLYFTIKEVPLNGEELDNSEE